ncbi:MAG: PAS domain-containing protein [Rhizobiales bacterium]|nr:PAS domain-containing protein [Hyphomicrobiales bacterium]
MQFILDELPVPLVYATHRIIRDCNHEFAALFGYDREELIDSGFHILYPKFADFLRTGEMWQTNMRNKSTYYDERVMRHNDQSDFWCRVRGQSTNADDPFAAAIYCFEPLNRVVEHKRHKLTDRQMQIIALVAQGKKNREIALELNRSVRTIEMHRARVMKQISVTNAAQLIAWFERQKYNDTNNEF